MGIRVRAAAVASAVVVFGTVALTACTATHHTSRAPSSAGSTSVSAPSSTTKLGPTIPSRSAPAHPSKPASSSNPAGAEAATGGAVGQCKITSSPDVASAFGGKVGTETAGTSGIGNPICRFTLAKSNAGAPGTVSVTLNASASATEFAQLKKQTQGGTSLSGVGDNAFYVSNTATLQFLKGHSAVVMQANIRVPGGMPPKPVQVRADSVALAKAIAANL